MTSSRTGRPPAAFRPDPPLLRPRQRECLYWVSQGKSSVDIGRMLNLSPRTIDEHVSGACRSLDVRTRVQAVARAIALGLIDAS